MLTYGCSHEEASIQDHKKNIKANDLSPLGDLPKLTSRKWDNIQEDEKYHFLLASRMLRKPLTSMLLLSARSPLKNIMMVKICFHGFLCGL